MSEVPRLKKELEKLKEAYNRFVKATKTQSFLDLEDLQG